MRSIAEVFVLAQKSARPIGNSLQKQIPDGSRVDPSPRFHSALHLPWLCCLALLLEVQLDAALEDASLIKC